MLLADMDAWVLKLLDPATLTGIATILGLYLKHRFDSAGQIEIKKEVVHGNQLTEAVLPAVTEKVESATATMQQTQEKATMAAKTAGVEVGIVIAKTLSDKADETANKVAEVTKASQKDMIDKVEHIRQAVRGEDGTCITSKLEDHGQRLTAVEQDVKSLKQTAELTLAIVKTLSETEASAK